MRASTLTLRSCRADVLDPHARRVAEAVLGHEESKRTHLVVALSGAHAYGFPSPDSDLDLKAIYLERFLGAHQLIVHPLLRELAPLARAGISKRYYRHYLGFAKQQAQAFDKSTAPTAKSVLYVLRTALTGAHLLRSAELRVDLTENLDEYGFADARELIARKRAGERVHLDEQGDQLLARACAAGVCSVGRGACEERASRTRAQRSTARAVAGGSQDDQCTLRFAACANDQLFTTLGEARSRERSLHFENLEISALEQRDQLITQ